MDNANRWLSEVDQYVMHAEQLHDVDEHEAMVQLAHAVEYALKGLQIDRVGSHRRGNDLIGLAHEESVPLRFHSTLAHLEQA